MEQWHHHQVNKRILKAKIWITLFIGDCDNMDFPNCSLVNQSPVNNGPATIYQTTVTGPNGQPTDLFSSGMQYSSKDFYP